MHMIIWSNNTAAVRWGSECRLPAFAALPVRAPASFAVDGRGKRRETISAGGGADGVDGVDGLARLAREEVAEPPDGSSAVSITYQTGCGQKGW